MFKKSESTRRANEAKSIVEKIEDPILHQSLGALAIVKEVDVDNDRAGVTMEWMSPAWEAKESISREIVQRLVSAGFRQVDVISKSRVLPARPSTGQETDLMVGTKNIVLFASGKGGVGKSTVASNVAAALGALGASVGLLDADIYGPSLPTMFGPGEPPTMTADGKRLVPVRRHGISLMSIGFLVDPTQAMTWRGPMLNSAVLQLMRDVDWGELDYLILDLPPGTGDVQLTIAQNARVSGACLVSTPQKVALDDVVRAKAMFDRVAIPTLGVIENMSTFVCPACKTRHPIFAHGGARQLADALGVPLLAEIPIETEVRQAGDEGMPMVLRPEQSPAKDAFFALARRVATELAIRAHEAKATHKPKSGALRIIQ